jgi:hypothetical protein
MFPMDPRKQAEQLFGLVLIFWICAYVIRATYELIRPMFGFFVAVMVVAAVARVWRRWHYRGW